MDFTAKSCFKKPKLKVLRGDKKVKILPPVNNNTVGPPNSRVKQQTPGLQVPLWLTRLLLAYRRALSGLCTAREASSVVPQGHFISVFALLTCGRGDSGHRTAAWESRIKPRRSSGQGSSQLSSGWKDCQCPGHLRDAPRAPSLAVALRPRASAAGPASCAPTFQTQEGRRRLIRKGPPCPSRAYTSPAGGAP